MTIDWWTLGLQTINVAILVWLLKRFFWRPVAGMIEQRRAEQSGLLAEAQAARDEAAAARDAIAGTRAGFAAERDALLAAARADAEKDAAARLDQAARDAAALQSGAQTAIAAAQASASLQWQDRAANLALDIAARLAARLDGAAEAQARCRAAIHDAFAARPEIDFTIDPALIAGLELHGDQFSIANSWRADLARIQDGLAHDHA